MGPATANTRAAAKLLVEMSTKLHSAKTGAGLSAALVVSLCIISHLVYGHLEEMTLAVHRQASYLDE